MKSQGDHQEVGWGRLWALPGLVLVLALTLGPLAFLTRLAFWGETGSFSLGRFADLAQPLEWRWIGFTFLFGCEVALFSFLLGFPVALWLRTLSGGWRATVLGLVLLPKLASVLVALFGWQRLLGGNGPIQWLFLVSGVFDQPHSLHRNHVGALIAETHQVLPLAILVMAVRLFVIDPRLEAAARGLGAGSWMVFHRITLPLAWPGIVVALELSLLWGWGAFLGPLFLGGPDETTLSVAFFHESFELMNWPKGATLGLVLIAMVGLGWALARSLLNRKDRHDQ